VATSGVVGENKAFDAPGKESGPQNPTNSANVPAIMQLHTSKEKGRQPCRQPARKKLLWQPAEKIFKFVALGAFCE
jgi:hypothetical protein